MLMVEHTYALHTPALPYKIVEFFPAIFERVAEFSVYQTANRPV